MSSADAGADRAIPAYAYLGPLLLALIIISVLTGAFSMAYAFILPVLRERGMSLVQLGWASGAANMTIWVVTTVLVLLTTYWSARSHMPWFAFLMSPGGRASRAQYWLKYWIPLAVLMLLVLAVMALAAVVTAVFAEAFWQAALADFAGQAVMYLFRVDLLLFWPAFAVMAKRLHDRGKSAWFMLILLIPIVGPIWLFIEVALLAGQKGDNRYGPDPLALAPAID